MIEMTQTLSDIQHRPSSRRPAVRPRRPLPALDDVQHLLLEDVTWELYERLLQAVGNRPIRLTFDEGRLEIMSPLPAHEGVKEFIGQMIENVRRWLGFGCKHRSLNWTPTP